MPMNATVGIGTTVTGVSWLPIIIVTAILIIGLFALILSSISRYRKLMGIFGFLGKCFNYFGKGLIALSIFGSTFLGVGFLVNGAATGAIDLWGLSWLIVEIIGAFFGIAGLGYLFDRLVWKRISKFNKKLEKERKA